MQTINIAQNIIPKAKEKAKSKGRGEGKEEAQSFFANSQIKKGTDTI